MSASSDYLNVLTSITREGGATRAATARANSQIWGNAVAKLGDFASDAIKQYSVDKKAKKDEKWQQDISDLFKRSAEEFKAQQEPSMAELTSNGPNHQTLEQRAAGMPANRTQWPTFGPSGGGTSLAQPGNDLPQQGGITGTQPNTTGDTFTGPELKNARPTRQSPFPTPSEILALGQPLNGIKVIDGLAALQKLNPQDDPATRLKRMQASYVALDQFSDKEKAAALPGLMGAFEQVYGINLGEKTFTPERWAAMGKALQIPTNKNEAKIAQITVPGAEGPMTKFVEEKAGAEYPQYVKPDKEATITPYQQAEIDRQNATAAETARHNKATEARLGAQASAANAPPVEIKPGSPEYQVAKDLASGKLTMLDFQRLYGRAEKNAGLRQGIYYQARQFNPDFEPAQFELGFKMAGNPQIRQRVVAINALDPVIDRIEALVDQSGNTGLPGFNKLLNSAKFQLGNRTVTDMRQLQTLLGDEIGIALGVGTGSDLKTKLGIDMVNPNLSPANFRDTMEQARTILGQRRGELVKTMGVYGGAADSASSGPKVGDIKTFPNGNKGRWDGKGWELVK